MEYFYRNILKDPPQIEELFSLAGRGGVSVADLVNIQSKNFKEMKLDLANLSEEEIVSLLSANPRVMHRPLLTDGERLIIGFKPELFRELLA